MTLDMSQQFPSNDVDDLLSEAGRPVGGSPFVAIPFLASAVRRRKRIVAVAGAFGVLLAVLFSVMSPPPYVATTTILLVHGAQAVPNREMSTDLGLLKTTTVAREALKALAERSSPQMLLGAYQGVPVSDDLLKITAQGPTSATAARRADAVAKAFIDFRSQEFQRQTQLAIRSIQDRQGLLTTELTDVNNQINATPTGQQSEAAIRAFGDLLTRRTSLNDQISTLQQQIDTETRDTQAIVDQTRVVDPASPNERAVRSVIAGDMAAGLVGGIALAIGFVVINAIASDRVRRRDDIALALRARVGVSVPGKFPRRRRPLRRRFTRHLAHPDPDLTRIERHLGHCLERIGSVKPSMLVLSVDSDGPAAVAVASTAAWLARQGSKVLVVDLTLDSTLARLVDVGPRPVSTMQFEPGASTITVVLAPTGTTATTLGLDQLRANADGVLLLGRLNPGLGTVPLVEWASTAVAVVTGARSTAAALRSAAQMLRVAGLGLDSTIVIGADADDDSLGVPDWGVAPAADDVQSAWTSR